MAQKRSYTNMMLVPKDGKMTSVYYIRLSKGQKGEKIEVKKFCKVRKEHILFVTSKITWRS